MSNRANLANGITATAVNTSSATVALQTGYVAGMPPTPFYATITPFGQLPTMGNSEIVQVVAVAGDNLIVIRAQKGTTAKSFAAGAVVTNSVYADDLVMPEGLFVRTGDTLMTIHDNKSLPRLDGHPSPQSVKTAIAEITIPDRFVGWQVKIEAAMNVNSNANALNDVRWAVSRLEVGGVSLASATSDGLQYWHSRRFEETALYNVTEKNKIARMMVQNRDGHTPNAYVQRAQFIITPVSKLTA